MIWVKMTAADTLFFRDGRPFNHGEMSLQAVPSQFPPPIPTLVGALRAALARGRGWESGPWNTELKDLLGDGDDLGPLRFQGPYLRWQNDDLYPAPATLLGKKSTDGWSELTLLKPGLPRSCDLGEAVRLPIPESPADGLKEVNHAWLRRSGMERLLTGKAPSPEDLVAGQQIVRHETRIGIGRDAERRAVEEGKLYCTRHLRPLDAETGFVCGIANLPPESPLPRLAPLGGETRAAWVGSTAGPDLPTMPELHVVGDRIHYTVTLLTPADVDSWPQPGRPFAQLPGELVSACLRRPERIGGWDSIRRQPKPLKPLLPAGTVLFLQTDADNADALSALHGQSIGSRTAWGFGQILIGTWKEGGK